MVHIINVSKKLRILNFIMADKLGQLITRPTSAFSDEACSYWTSYILDFDSRPSYSGTTPPILESPSTNP